jgi:hypothetical protein
VCLPGTSFTVRHAAAEPGSFPTRPSRYPRRHDRPPPFESHQERVFGATPRGMIGAGARPRALCWLLPAAPFPRPKRFHGTATLDTTRVGRDAGRIADEVIAHLSGLIGSSVKVTLEIEVNVFGGVPENVVRTVTENSRTLKFSSHGFEQE